MWISSFPSTIFLKETILSPLNDLGTLVKNQCISWFLDSKFCSIGLYVFSHVQLFVTPMNCSPPGSSVHRSFPGKNTGAGYHFLLQGIFLPRDWTRFSCISCIGRWILYHLHHQTVSINLYVSPIPVLYCLDFGCFVFSFKMRKCDSYSFVLFQYF